MVKRHCSGGLVLDDYLDTVLKVRQRFHLTPPTFSLGRESEPATRAAIDSIIEGIIDQCGTHIYSKVHPLLAGAGNEVYAGSIKTGVYSGRNIRQDRIGQTLRRAIEVGLQTIAQLPSREAKPASVPKRLKSLSSTLIRLSKKLNAMIRGADVRNHIDLWEDDATRARLLRLPGEIQWGSEALNAIARLKVTKIRMNSPNPQISFMMYLLGWIEAGTGRQHYEDLTTLIQAAFVAVRKPPPKWTDRLAIERHLQRKWRKKWIERISS